MVLQTLYEKGPRPLLWAGSRIAHGRIAVTGIPYCLNYCEIFIVYSVFYCKSLCIIIVVYVLLLLSMYYHYYCCLCILNVVYVFLLFVHVFLLLSMYSYCSSKYSYCCLCILIAVYVFLDAATLTEVFPCFFLGCKANARV